MFETLQAAPPDPILGLQSVFKSDPRPAKVNLTVGVYCDDSGKTPSLQVALAAEKRLLEKHPGHGYLPIEGMPEFGAAVRDLVFGAGSALVKSGRAITCQTPGGTGGCRIAGDLAIMAASPGAVAFISDPTWPSHPGIFEASGFKARLYPYFDAARNALNFEGMLAALKESKRGDVVVLHGCCHNPTGVDPTPAQWTEIAAVLAKTGALPVVDFAYQGFGDGLAEDAACVRAVEAVCPEFVVVTSFSKNLGLYGERTGAATVVCADAKTAEVTMTRIRQAVRKLWSNPPAHGGRVATLALTDPALRPQWEAELNAMRLRIAGVRQGLKDGLDARGVQLNPAGNGFITAQKGLFTMTGLNKAQVERLWAEHAVMLVGNGRMNAAGLTSGNLAQVVDAIAKVVKG